MQTIGRHAHITQAPIENGQVYRYEFTVVQAGTYVYHSHDHVDRQQAYAARTGSIQPSWPSSPTI